MAVSTRTCTTDRPADAAGVRSGNATRRVEASSVSGEIRVASSSGLAETRRERLCDRFAGAISQRSGVRLFQVRPVAEVLRGVAPPAKAAPVSGAAHVSRGSLLVMTRGGSCPSVPAPAHDDPTDGRRCDHHGSEPDRTHWSTFRCVMPAVHRGWIHVVHHILTTPRVVPLHRSGIIQDGGYRRHDTGRPARPMGCVRRWRPRSSCWRSTRARCGSSSAARRRDPRRVQRGTPVTPRRPGTTLDASGTDDDALLVECQVGRVEEEHLTDLGVQRVHPQRGDRRSVCGVGTVSFSPTLSASRINASISSSWSSERPRGPGVVGGLAVLSLSDDRGRSNARHRDDGRWTGAAHHPNRAMSIASWSAWWSADRPRRLSA